MSRPKTVAGKKTDQYHSLDTFSPGYFRSIRRVREHCWYDVHPYSLAIWPHLYSDKIRSGNWWIRRHNYDAVAVELQLEGTSVYKTGSACDELHPGELYLTIPGSSVHLASGGGAGRQELLVISGGMVKLLVESLNLPSSRRIRIDNPADFTRVRAMFDRTADLLRDRRLESALENSTNGYSLICLLADYGSRTREDGLPPLLTHAVRMMANGYGCRFSIGELAGQLGISRVTLNNLFRQYLGTSPLAYRHRLCMENAIQLVRSEEFSFKEISEQLGFRNSLYFSTVFRRYTGMTPTEYRRFHAEKPEKSRPADEGENPSTGH